MARPEASVPESELVHTSGEPDRKGLSEDAQRQLERIKTEAVARKERAEAKAAGAPSLEEIRDRIAEVPAQRQDSEEVVPAEDLDAGRVQDREEAHGQANFIVDRAGKGGKASAEARRAKKADASQEAAPE